MKIVHISDTHSSKYHSKLNIPECDVLIHSGDIGGRVMMFELAEFLKWFESQPAKVKIYVPGNHDLILDKDWVKNQKSKLDSVAFMLLEQQHLDSLNLISNYNIIYLNNKDYVYNGVKFYGSPYSPSFHREYWAFNADRGNEIRNIWNKIPKDVDVLITHSPVYNILDDVKEYKRDGEDPHVGCKDLKEMINKKLINLKLHCSGHIHDNYGILLEPVSHTRKVLFSNGAVLTNQYTQLITSPLIINL